MSHSVVSIRTQTRGRVWIRQADRLTIWGLGICLALGSSAGIADAGPAEDHLNVILISLDTVRPDHLSSYGYHRQTTPHIDRIAQEGVTFMQAFAQAPDTLPSHLALFTSRYPRRPWIFWEEAEVAPGTETLTDLLKREGYETAMFAGFGHERPIDRLLTNAGPFRGFHRSDFVSLKSLPRDLFDWLQDHREAPFFLFVHGFDAHEPHVLPIQYDAKRFNPTYEGRLPSTTAELDRLAASVLSIGDVQSVAHEVEFRLKRRAVYEDLFRSPEGVSPEDLEHLLALYDAQLYYLDQGLGHLFTALQQLDLMERTLMVIVSDHGQAFGEHGTYATHGRGYDEVTRMVLIVRDPQLASARRGQAVPQIVQGIDVMPTILELLDLPVPESSQGRSLVPLLQTGQDSGREDIAISLTRGMRVIRTPKWKLISVEGIPTELYHLQTDAKEQRNVITRHPELTVRLQHQLDAVVRAEVVGKVVDQQQWRQERSYW